MQSKVEFAEETHIFPQKLPLLKLGEANFVKCPLYFNNRLQLCNSLNQVTVVARLIRQPNGNIVEEV